MNYKNLIAINRKEVRNIIVIANVRSLTSRTDKENAMNVYGYAQKVASGKGFVVFACFRTTEAEALRKLKGELTEASKSFEGSSVVESQGKDNLMTLTIKASQINEAKANEALISMSKLVNRLSLNRVKTTIV